MTSPTPSEGEMELRPCPFCGGNMQHRHALWPSEGDSDGIIHTSPTECPADGFSIGTADKGMSVAAAWNRRPSDPVRADLVEMLKHIVRVVDDGGSFDPICSPSMNRARAILSRAEE